MALDLALILAAYLIGSFSTAVVACRMLGLGDPRGAGSGNPGATNVLRTGGRQAALITLAGDVLKGLLPVLLARALGAPDAVLAGVALAAFLGHLYPVYYRLRGGKGVATALGVLLGLHWLVGLLTLITWLAVALAWRYASLAALVAAPLVPVYAALVTGSPWLCAAAVAMALLVYWRHRSNIQHLLAGSEEKSGRDGP